MLGLSARLCSELRMCLTVQLALWNPSRPTRPAPHRLVLVRRRPLDELRRSWIGGRLSCLRPRTPRELVSLCCRLSHAWLGSWSRQLPLRPMSNLYVHPFLDSRHISPSCIYSTRSFPLFFFESSHREPTRPSHVSLSYSVLLGPILSHFVALVAAVHLRSSTIKVERTVWLVWPLPHQLRYCHTNISHFYHYWPHQKHTRYTLLMSLDTYELPCGIWLPAFSTPLPRSNGAVSSMLWMNTQ